jgi:hypothetical protein
MDRHPLYLDALGIVMEAELIALDWSVPDQWVRAQREAEAAQAEYERTSPWAPPTPLPCRQPGSRIWRWCGPVSRGLR